MSDQVLEQRSPAAEKAPVERHGGTSLLFVRSSTGHVVVDVHDSVSAVGAPAELQQIARGIVNEFGEALDRLAK
jgi:hypothetical protein